MTPYEFQIANQSRYASAETRAVIMETARKLYKHFSENEKILVSVSGGSDSDCIVHLICKYFPEFLPKIHFVFVNTGLEYEATKRHLCELEKRYGIEIKRIRGLSIVTAVRRYGVPILNKSRSSDIEYYLHGAEWAHRRIDEGEKTGTRYAYTENIQKMIHYIKNAGFRVSAKCCDKSKKAPVKKYIKENAIELNVTGERKCEGGQRAAAHKSCFELHKDGMKKYMPLFWWGDDVKADFKTAENIRFSDCYVLYGMKRTGCAGCPFNLDVSDDLQIMRKFEPKLYNACISVFGKSYILMDIFNARRKQCFPE